MKQKNRLVSNIQLGASFKQFFEWEKRNNIPEHVTVQQIAAQLTHKCKTKPEVYGLRTASLIGNIYDTFEGEFREWALDMAIQGIHLANKNLKK